MESRAKILGHAGHQMLVVFPLGMLTAAVVADFVGIFTGDSFWYRMTFYLIAGGVVTGLAAAAFGAVDYFAIPNDTRAKSIGFIHGVGNVVVMVLFAASWLLRYTNDLYVPSVIALVLSVAAAGLSGITAWFGGELVDRLGVGVDDGANLNAPNSLTNKSVKDTVREL